MSDDQPTGDRWLTYAELGEILRISPEAARAVARRHKWVRQPANAVGRVVRVLVPADRIRPITANGQERSGQRPSPNAANGQNISGQWPSSVAYAQNYALKLVANGQGVTSLWPNPDSANEQEISGHWPHPDAFGHDHNGGQRSNPDSTNGQDISGHWPSPDESGHHQYAKLREIADVFLAPVREQLAGLSMQLDAERERADRERERADRADQRAREAETRVKEAQEKLESELVEHRRVVGLLAEQLSARRSWWRWRRR
jgi:hypothetical protein